MWQIIVVQENATRLDKVQLSSGLFSRTSTELITYIGWSTCSWSLHNEYPHTVTVWVRTRTLALCATCISTRLLLNRIDADYWSNFQQNGNKCCCISCRYITECCTWISCRRNWSQSFERVLRLRSSEGLGPLPTVWRCSRVRRLAGRGCSYRRSHDAGPSTIVICESCPWCATVCCLKCCSSRTSLQRSASERTEKDSNKRLTHYTS